MAIRDISEESTDIGQPAPEQPAPQLGIPPRRSIQDLRADATQRLQGLGMQRPGAPGTQAAGNPELDDLLHKASTFGQTPPKEGMLAGTGKAVMGGLAGIGSQVAGLGEYAASRFTGPESGITQGLHAGRTLAQQGANYWQSELTPQEQELGERQWATLDPHKTIFQGGPKEAMHAIALQVAGAAPAALTTLLGAAGAAKIGIGAITYIGATQTGLSIGQLANNISDDIQNTPEDVLRQRSPAYAQKIAGGMDPIQARQELTTEAQKYAPVIGGLVSGAIATVAGRFLTPVLSKEGASLGARVGGGFADQAIQQGGTAGTDYIAREAAAHTYDSSRNPDLAEAGKQALEGAITGGITGAGFGAVMGHGPRGREPMPNQQNPGEAHAGMETTAGTEDHTTSMSTDEYTPTERNREGFETLTGQKPHIIVPGQQEMNLPQAPEGVAPDVAAALSSRHEVSHWNEPPPAPPYQGAPAPETTGPRQPAGFGMQEANGPQGNLDLRGGQMNPPRPGPTPPANVPGQMNLPFEQRQRGVGRQQMQPMVEPPPTRADELRARAAPPPTPDENQPDLFRDQPVPGQLTTRTNRPMLAGSADHPSAEPFGDIRAQLKDLADPNHERGGVYLSADNIARLRRDGLLDQIRASAGDQAVPMVNFDEKGGTLIAKDQAHADEYAHYRDAKVGDMQEILGHATGAGSGKPDNGNFIVQQHDDQGNVTRETGVATEQEAHQLAQQYADVARGRTAQVTTASAAVLRRAQLIGFEHEQVQRTQSEKGASRAVSTAVERNVSRGDLLRARAESAAHRDLASGQESHPVSREEAAGRLTAEARKLQNEVRSRSWRGAGFPDPDDVVFHSPDAQRQYEELDRELAGMQVMRNTARSEADIARARTGLGITENRVASFLKANPHETTARQVGRAALEVSPEGAKAYVENKRAAGRKYVKPHTSFNPEVLTPAKRPTRAEIHGMNEAQLQHTYEDVLERSQGGARTKLTAEAMRSEDEGVRSKMEKRINRFFRGQEKSEELGHAQSEKFAVSPRRALTEREQRVNAAKAGTKARRLVGFKTFDPEALMTTVESQREMERAAKLSPAEQKAERVQQYTDLSDAIKRGERHLEGMMSLKRENLKSEGSPLMAQRYLRELLQYGRALKGQSLRSPEARSAAKKFATLMDALGKKEPAKRAQYLIDTYKTELQRQARSAARANPERLTHDDEGYPIKAAPVAGEAVEKHPILTALEAQERNASLRSHGQQLDIPFPETVQPKFGYTGLKERFTPAHEDELAALLNAKKEGYRGESGKFERRPRQGATALREMQEAAHQQAIRNEAEARARGETQNLNPDQEGSPQFSAYQLRHEAEVARRQAEEGVTPEIESEPFAGRQIEHEAEVARRLKEDQEFRSSLGYPQKPTAVDNAARVAAYKMEHAYSEGAGIGVHEILPDMIRELPEGSPAHKLFTALSKVVDRNTMVGYANSDMFTNGINTSAHVRWHEAGPIVRINRDALELARASGDNPTYALLHALGHELTHIATSRAIEGNIGVRNRLQAILNEVQRQPGAGKFYGAASKDVHEMVAEAYSNRKFQDFLNTVRMPNVGRSLWSMFKQVVGDILGFRSTDQHFSALDAIMREHGTIFRGKQYATTKGELTRLRLQNLEKDPDGKHVGNAFDRIVKSVNFDKQTMKNLAADATQGLGQKGLSAMTPRQQSAQFSKYFEKPDGTNPYKRYWDTFFKRAADNAISMERVGKISNNWSNLEERYGIDTAASVSKLMHDSTIYQFHPDLALAHEQNEHLTSPEQQARQKAGAAVFNKLPAEWQEHFQTMKKYYADEQRNSTDQIVLNGLHAMLTKGEDAAMTPKEFDSKYDAAAVRRLGLDTEEGLQKEFGDRLSGASQSIITKIGTITNRPGPYFPLMRNGDYVVSAERKMGSKEFDSSREAQSYVASQRASDPTLSVSVKATDDGTWRVSTSEKEVRMAESKSEANQHRRDMVGQYGEENVKPVQLKADLYKGEGSITTGSALDNILRKLDDNPAAQTAIKDFYLRSLGDQSFRKRELTRSNRRGVNIENQHRSFAQYGRSQSYYLSQLKYGRHLANAQGDVQRVVSDHRDESQVSAVRMGEFARELALRDEISRNPYKVSDLVRRGTSLTGFMMLTSPSHWFVRAAQPYVLSAPWLGARHGFAESVGALGRAQAMIADPLLKETVQSGLGLKALFSRAAAEKSYTVIDQVLAHIKANAGADADKITAMVQHLRDNNLIDLSMATELSDISKGRDTGLTARVLDASRIMLHLCEVNNRVLTAVAARELGLKAGMTEAQAVEHAADAINVTHNDYSYGNTPRMFMAQSKGLLGGARPLLFQFMKYPQQVYGMMISSGLAALKGKSPQERAIGVKTLLGVLATHLIAAGAVGATIQPIKWAMGAVMAGASALGLTDEPYTVASAMSGETYDNALRGVMSELFGTEMGELLSKGLPTAVGVDLSQRMALGSTYMFHLKTDSDASTIGSIAESVGGPWLNVAENFWDAGKKFLSGDVLGGIEHMTPHLIRDLVKAGQMSQKGVVDNAGNTLIPADKLSAPEIFAQSLGFRPDQIAETLNRNNAERSALQNVSDQKKALIKQFAGAEPNERQAVREQVQAFNHQHPGFAIDASTLFKAVAQKQATALEMQKYGVRARAKQLPEVTGAGSAFNVQ